MASLLIAASLTGSLAAADKVKPELLLPLGHTTWVMNASFSPDCKTVLTGSIDHVAKLWDAATGRLIHTFAGLSGRFESASFSPDGRWVIGSIDDNTARVLDTATGRLIHTLAGHTETVNCALFSPDGKTVLTGSDDKTASASTVLN